MKALHSGWLRVALIFAPLIFMGSPAPAAEREGSYAEQRQNCVNGRTRQDRAACMKEVNAVHARPPADEHLSPERYRDNALLRCQRLPDRERYREDCHSRMSDQARTSGDALSGGIYREWVRREEIPLDRPLTQ
jgi:hypothetical protein